MRGLLILLLTALIGLSSCYFDEGPRGPRGYDGRDGIDGVDGEEGYVFEYEFSFTAPDYSELLLLPDDFVMLDSDVMLVYFLWEVTEDGVEIWRSLPQTMYFSDGVLEYNYDFTKYDASVFLDGNINFDALGAAYTDNWIARVVVVPAQYGGRGGVDYSNYDEVKAYFGLSDTKLGTSGYVKRPQ
ncbi:hypothetical protein [Ekhidna sp.]|uniref:hypothetical protein n=1 Tax=Ekhidna sp. TaxID=2608089 RepID=UPI003C7AD706